MRWPRPQIAPIGVRISALCEIEDRSSRRCHAETTFNRNLHIKGCREAHYPNHNDALDTNTLPGVNDGCRQLREFSIFLDQSVSKNNVMAKGD